MSNFIKISLLALFLFISSKPTIVLPGRLSIKKNRHLKHKLLRENKAIREKLFATLKISMQVDLRIDSFIIQSIDDKRIKVNNSIISNKTFFSHLISNWKYPSISMSTIKGIFHNLYIIDRIIFNLDTKNDILEREYISDQFLSVFYMNLLDDYRNLKKFLFLFTKTTVSDREQSNYDDIDTFLSGELEFIVYDYLSSYILFMKKNCNKMIASFFSLIPKYIYKKNDMFVMNGGLLRPSESFVLFAFNELKKYRYYSRDINYLMDRIFNELYV